MDEKARIEVFYTTCPTTPEREKISYETLDWWKSQPVNLRVVTPMLAKCSVAEFNRLRRVYADQVAKGDHIVADDDAIPLCDIREAFGMFQRYPDFGTLSLWPEPCVIHPWTEIEAFEDDEVMEHCSVGVIRLCRKGMPFPPSESVGYDRTHADAIRAIGKKVGLLKNYRCKHLGENKSTLWTAAAQ